MSVQKAINGLLFGLILCLTNDINAEALKEDIEFSVRLESLASIERGTSYLLQSQIGNGSWGDHPAITSLVAVALANAPEDAAVDTGNAVEKALNYLKAQVHDDGSLWNANTKQYKLYSAALGALALVRCNRPGDFSAIGKIRDFLVASQKTDKSSNTKPAFYGGFEVDCQKNPTLTVTQWVVEALYLIDSLRLPNDLIASSYRKRAKTDIYTNAINFIKRCRYRNVDTGNGGKSSKVGSFNDIPTDVTTVAEIDKRPRTPRSRVFLTCLGIKSLRYAGYSKDKPALETALDYVEEHWNISKNPGLGMKGYYTYIYALSKALKSMDISYIETPDGAKHYWRGEIITELLSRQKGNGAWRQATSAWWENNPSLVTAYAILTMEQCLTPQ